MAMDACKNSDNVDFSLVPQFSKYYESVRNHHWMVFRPECKTHIFAYKAYVQGKRENDRELEKLQQVNKLLMEAVESGIELQSINYGYGIQTHVKLIKWAELARETLQKIKEI